MAAKESSLKGTLSRSSDGECSAPLGMIGRVYVCAVTAGSFRKGLLQLRNKRNKLVFGFHRHYAIAIWIDLS